MRFSLKTVLYTALLLSAPGLVAGQRALGVRGGVNFSSFAGDDGEDFDPTTGYNFGAFFKGPVSDILGVQIGVGLAQKGAEDTEVGILTEITLNYLEVPLLLTLSPATFSRVGFTFSAGPVLGFNTGCNFKRSSATGVTELDVECENPLVNVEVKSFEVGAMVGVGVDIGLTESVSLLLDGLYNYGFTKVDDSGVDDDVKNRAFSLLVGLAFLAG